MCLTVPRAQSQQAEDKRTPESPLAGGGSAGRWLLSTQWIAHLCISALFSQLISQSQAVAGVIGKQRSSLGARFLQGEGRWLPQG